MKDPSEPYYMRQCERICIPCRIRWIATFNVLHDSEIPDGRECPECGADPFFTCSVGDIGTSIAMRRAGIALADLRWVGGKRAVEVPAPKGDADAAADVLEKLYGEHKK